MSKNKLPKEEKLDIIKEEVDKGEFTEDNLMRIALVKTFEKLYGPIKIRSGPPKKL